MSDEKASAARISPLPMENSPNLAPQFEAARAMLGFVPNSLLIMQRRPKMVAAFSALAAAVYDPEGGVDRELKQLIAHVASISSGCNYCIAHTGERAALLGIERAKLDAVWDYQHSTLFSAAERAAIDLAVAAGCTPNEVTDDIFQNLKQHFSDDQIVEIVGVVALFGFLNRWNDTMATPLEVEPLHHGEQHLARHGWSPDKHRRD